MKSGALSLKVFQTNSYAKGRTSLTAALFFGSNFEKTVECFALGNYETLITVIPVLSEDEATSLYSKLPCLT